MSHADLSGPTGAADVVPGVFSGPGFADGVGGEPQGSGGGGLLLGVSRLAVSRLVKVGDVTAAARAVSGLGSVVRGGFRAPLRE